MGGDNPVQRISLGIRSLTPQGHLISMLLDEGRFEALNREAQKVMRKVAPRLEGILRSLSPEVLRTMIALPHEQWREEFIPRFLSTASYEEMIEELGRFISHMRERWFSMSIEWPREHALHEARSLLNRALGDGSHPRAGEFAAMKACRHGDQGGMRMILDTLTRSLQGQALTRYIDSHILPGIYELTPDQSLTLAQAYLEKFRSLPGLERERVQP